ncbi:RNA 2',3'-cyclic phosphodiesterase [Shewanella sp. 3B26]|uniref:RNA 2',3'-cyclic phosphodiesterase n=1 Tax=Shewanella zhuhaiensis TaxID=2919576 RepID=A0AAJ1BH25_9GAMM|nr:RNA 2',3'-cyclic phosphodiesterase [Shewanella zhuhaiensis]MCH4294613.1 RNA 2',3'-cyclic phosphodiesterase [Shewanella zhuhaiensis]
MPDNKRLFLGFSLNSAQTASLQRLQHGLGEGAGTGVDVTPANLHMTLAFLGQADGTQEAALRDEITGLAKPRFRQRLDTLVHWRGAGVVCLWGKAEDSALIGMFEASQAIAAKLGLHQSEHAFNPHITLKRKARVFQKPEWTPTPLTLMPDALHLYHSQSTAIGVQYRILQSWPLAD